MVLPPGSHRESRVSSTWSIQPARDAWNRYHCDLYGPVKLRKIQLHTTRSRARASTPEAIPYIEAWTKKHFGRVIPVTNKKTFDIVELWDDRAVQVLPNTGIRVDSL